MHLTLCESWRLDRLGTRPCLLMNNCRSTHCNHRAPPPPTSLAIRCRTHFTAHVPSPKWSTASRVNWARFCRRCNCFPSSNSPIIRESRKAALYRSSRRVTCCFVWEERKNDALRCFGVFFRRVFRALSIDDDDDDDASSRRVFFPLQVLRGVAVCVLGAIFQTSTSANE